MSELDIRPVSYFELWPRQKWRWFRILSVLWLLALGVALHFDYQILNPFQRCYLPAYIRTTVYPDVTKPAKFALLKMWVGASWVPALPNSLPGYNGELKAGTLPTPLPPRLSLKWESLTPTNANLRAFLRHTFFLDQPLVALKPWSQRCVFLWSCLIALAFPLTLLGAVLIDFFITKRLRSGVVIAGTRLHIRTSFLRNIVRWKFLWAPWKLGLTFRVIGRPYLSDLFLAPLWLLCRGIHRATTYYLREFASAHPRQFICGATSLLWLGVWFNLHRFNIHVPDVASLSIDFVKLLPLIAFASIATLMTLASFLPTAFFRLSNALCPRILGIPADKENQHLLLMGDTGTGKSSLLRQIIRSIRARRETLVIYDPDGTYASEFYDPQRGDVILNPLDARCPYWQPNSEIHDAGEAETLAAGYYPQIAKSSGSTEFFYTAARKILAYLFTHRATAAEIANWLSDPDTLTNLLKHTELKQYVAEYAGQMRGGVEATLSAVVNGLRLLPPEYEDPDPNNPNAALRPRRPWSALTWATTRRGWVFITNDKAHRISLMPLISAWLDNILLRLMATKPQGACPNVWVVMDELASLHRLPQLEVGLTEIRKHHVSMVLGFQGIAQLQENYTEHPAEVILSQPATKIFLRTSENKGAKWISDYLGQQDLEITSKTQNQKTGVSFSKKTEKVAVVSPTTIAHLKDLTGFMSHGNFVTSLKLPYTKAVERHPAHLPRSTKPFTLREPPLSVRPAPSELTEFAAPVIIPDIAAATPPSQPHTTGDAVTAPGPAAATATADRAPDTSPGFWFGKLAMTWGLLFKPVYSEQLAYLVNSFHPVTHEPFAAGGVDYTHDWVEFRLPVPVPTATAVPSTTISPDSLLAHYASVIASVGQRYPESEFGPTLGVMFDEDPTPATANSPMLLNSTVCVYHGPAHEPSAVPTRVPRPPHRSDPPSASAPLHASNSQRITPSSRPHLSALHAVTLPPSQLSVPGLVTQTHIDQVTALDVPAFAPFKATCAACQGIIDAADPLLPNTVPWRHLTCPGSPANA